MKRTTLRIRILMTWVILASFFVGSIHSQQSTAISIDGAQIYYKTFGKGQPLLIINGGPGMNSDGFEGLAVSLSEHFMTIIYDQRGQVNLHCRCWINYDHHGPDAQRCRKYQEAPRI
ncbi:MAG: hypothetical protein IPP25_15045 [Saprospiraceae bacterium]|nr:hypothetical protein [Candidatus Opimibacter skivensis]